MQSLILLLVMWVDLNLKSNYELYEPIVITVKNETPADCKTVILWQADFEWVELNSKSIAVWARPGDHVFSGILFHTQEVEIAGKKLNVMVGTPEQFSSQFRVGLPIPVDPFEAMVAKWSEGLAQKDVVAALFDKWSKYVTAHPTEPINSISDKFATERRLLLTTNDAKWTPFLKSMNEDVKAKWPIDIAKYWMAVSKGLLK